MPANFPWALREVRSAGAVGDGGRGPSTAASQSLRAWLAFAQDDNFGEHEVLRVAQDDNVDHDSFELIQF